MRKYQVMLNEGLDFSIQKEWNNLVVEATEGTFFHSFEWYQILMEYGRYTGLFNPQIFMIKEESENGLVGLLWLFLDDKGVANSPRFGDYGGPLLSSHLTINEKKIVLKLLLQKIDAIRGKAHKIFLRISNDQFHNVYLQNGYQVRPNFFTFLLPINRGIDHIYSEFRRDAKRGIKIAIKNGVTVEKILEKEQLRKYYLLYTATMEKLNASPRKFAFFEIFWDVLIRQNRLRVLLARYHDEFIAGIMTISWNSALHIFSNVSASHSNRVHPNDLLYYETIKWAVKTSHKMVDFGLTSLNPKSGLYQFKKRWGGRPELLYSASKMYGIRNVLAQIFR
jgi:predicted N-acyltransferase